MPFSLFGKRKKYPFNKQKKDPAAAVYAGPEFFARRQAKAEAEALVIGVYAGPEPPAAGMGGISGSMGMMGAAFVPAPQAPPAEEGKADGEE